MERVLITGAAGFLGRALAERLRADGREVVGVDRHADPASNIVAGDISQAGEWQHAAAGCDVLIHTAALVGMPSDTSAFHAVNVVGVRRTIEAARDHGVRRVVHISSVVTFGLDFPDRVDERHPVKLTGAPYTDTKIASEQVALMAHAAGEQEVAVIRPGDIYGPRSRPWTLMPLELMRSRRLVLPALGRAIHSPVYVDDVVDGIALAAATPAAAGRVITLSGGVGVQTRDYFGRLARAGKVPAPTVVPTAVALAGATAIDRIARVTRAANELTPDGVRYLAQRRGTYGIETARQLLGWAPKVDLDDGMVRVAESLTARPVPAS